MAEETLPRCAENIALALGALCAVRFHRNVASIFITANCLNIYFNLFVVSGVASCCS